MKPNKQEMVRHIVELKERIKALNKEEAELKLEIKRLMGSKKSMDVGEYIVIRSMRSRSDLDKERIALDLGSAFIRKYTKQTEYEILEIKAKESA